MPTVTLEYYGVSGTGKNLTEAKRDAGAKIERALKNRSPRLYRYRGAMLIVWTEPEGDCYRIVWPDTRDGSVDHGCTMTRDNGDACGLKHLIDIMRTEGEYEMPDWVPARIARDHGARWLADWRSNDEFQRRYREAQARGMTDGDCHAYACGRIELAGQRELEAACDTLAAAVCSWLA